MERRKPILILTVDGVLAEYETNRPVTGARAALLRLIDIVTPIIICSSPSCIAWIRRFYRMIDPKHIVITDDPSCVQGDIYIDDRIDHLSNHVAHAIIMQYPHNETWIGEQVSNWAEAEERIQQYLS